MPSGTGTPEDPHGRIGQVRRHRRRGGISGGRGRSVHHRTGYWGEWRSKHVSRPCRCGAGVARFPWWTTVSRRGLNPDRLLLRNGGSHAKGRQVSWSPGPVSEAAARQLLERMYARPKAPQRIAEALASPSLLPDGDVRGAYSRWSRRRFVKCPRELRMSGMNVVRWMLRSVPSTFRKLSYRANVSPLAPGGYERAIRRGPLSEAKPTHSDQPPTAVLDRCC